MKMSGGVEWALHCCVVLTRPRPVPAQRLAELHDVSAHLPGQAAAGAVAAGLVRSAPGSAGGYVAHPRARGDHRARRGGGGRRGPPGVRVHRDPPAGPPRHAAGGLHDAVRDPPGHVRRRRGVARRAAGVTIADLAGAVGDDYGPAPWPASGPGSRRPRRRGAASPGRCRGRDDLDDRLDDAAGRTACPGSARSSSMRLGSDIARAVGAVGRHRAEGVAGADDARRERDRLAREAVRVAAAVPALVVARGRSGRPRASTPPTRSSICCPSTGWRLTISHSSRSSLPGLLMISLGTRDLADVVQQRAELEVAPRRARRGRARRRRRATSATTPLAVLAAGVGVVGLEHVAHQQRGAAVGVAELDRVLDALLALAGEARASSPISGMSRAAAARPPGVATRGQEADRAPAATSTRTLKPRMRSCSSGGTPEREPLAQRRDDDVDDDLRGERQQVQPPQSRLAPGCPPRRAPPRDRRRATRRRT